MRYTVPTVIPGKRFSFYFPAVTYPFNVGDTVTGRTLSFVCVLVRTLNFI